MEKCTFCIQRIKRGQLDAGKNGQEIKDGDIQPACAQACPTEAIVFGNLAEKDSRVSRLAESKRANKLLEEVGTDPKVIYLSGEDPDQISLW